MSDFYTDSIVRTARKLHKCTYCAEGIAKGDEYIFQKGNWDGLWFENKMHEECFDALCEFHEDGYTMYDNERPRKT